MGAPALREGADVVFELAVGWRERVAAALLGCDGDSLAVTALLGLRWLALLLRRRATLGDRVVQSLRHLAERRRDLEQSLSRLIGLQVVGDRERLDLLVDLRAELLDLFGERLRRERDGRLVEVPVARHLSCSYRRQNSASRLPDSMPEATVLPFG
jgi:hypothetical protein